MIVNRLMIDRMAATASTLPPQQVLRAPFESTHALAAAAIPQVMRNCPWPPAAAMAWSPDTLAGSIPQISPVLTQQSRRAIVWNPASTHALEWNARFYINATRDATAEEVDGAEVSMSPADFFRPPAGHVHYARIEVPREGDGAVHGAYREVRRRVPRSVSHACCSRSLTRATCTPHARPAFRHRSSGVRIRSLAWPRSHRRRSRLCGSAPPAP